MPRNIAVALVVVFVVATGVLVYLGNKYDDTLADTTSTPATTETAAPTTAVTDPEPTPDLRRGDSNVSLDPIDDVADAPQFVLFSLDGAGSHDLWQQYLAAADESDARFTAFLSGVYLLADENADRYTPPGRDPGRSSLGFGGSVADVAIAASDIAAAYEGGHDIATHYNGHFCAGDNPSGDDWSAADWSSELDQFFAFLRTWPELNGVAGGVDAPGDVINLSPVADAVTGGRTPCMEGDLSFLAPLWASRGMTWDASKNLYTGIGWPQQVDGIWEFQIPYAESPAMGRNVIAVDYNMAAVFSGSDAALQRAVAETYRYWFDQAHDGNRAPVVIPVHSDGAYSEEFSAAALGLMRDVCGMDSVVCATFADVTAWLEAQDDDVVAALQARSVVAAG